MEQPKTIPTPRGRKRKYFFSDLVVGGSQEYKGDLADQNRLTAAASAYSKKFHGGAWKFTCRSGTQGDIKVVTVTRTA